MSLKKEDCRITQEKKDTIVLHSFKTQNNFVITLRVRYDTILYSGYLPVWLLYCICI